MIDFHCHLDLYPDANRVVEECRRRNIYTLSVTTTPSAWEGTTRLIANSPRIRIALGLHPELAHERKQELHLFDKLVSSTRYVGEVGLDGSPNFVNHWDDQLTVFEHILNSCSKVGGRIMSIHSRSAATQVLETLHKYPNSGKAVLHWFSGSLSELDTAIASGCWFSIGYGMLKSTSGQSLVKRMPRGRVLTESDGPFVKIGTQAIMPWDMNIVTKSLSTIWNLNLEETIARLHDNLKALTGYA